jgi:hypothetical protein
LAFFATFPTLRPALPTVFPADFAVSSTVSRTASTGLPAEPLLRELEERLLVCAAGLGFFAVLAFVDLDLGDRLGRAEVDRFFV